MAFKLEITKQSNVPDSEFLDGRDEKYFRAFNKINFSDYDQKVRKLLYEQYKMTVGDAIKKNPKKLTDIIYENWNNGIDADITANHLGTGNI